MTEETSLTNKLPLLVILTSISLFLMLLDGFGMLLPVRRAVEYVSVPVKFGLYRGASAVENNVMLLFEIKEQDERIRFLEGEINKLHVATVTINTLQEENEALKKQLTATDPTAFSLLLAHVLGGQRYLGIDKGSDHGVEEGMVVLSENIIVGKVIKTSPRFSQVQLVTDPDSKIAVEVFVEKGTAKGILYGQFQSGLLLDQVLQEEQIKEGDLIVTSGENQQYPKGMLIGEITEVVKEEADVFQKAKVKPLVDMRTTRVVFVVK